MIKPTYVCPACEVDLDRTIKDVLRKTDESGFECPSCGTDLVATAIRIITVRAERESGSESNG